MARNPSHARQFKYSVPKPDNVKSHDVLKWLYSNFGKSSVMDLHTGTWYFDVGNTYPYKPAYFFKHEQDAVYFKLTWE